MRVARRGNSVGNAAKNPPAERAHHALAGGRKKPARPPQLGRAPSSDAAAAALAAALAPAVVLKPALSADLVRPRPKHRAAPRAHVAGVGAVQRPPAVPAPRINKRLQTPAADGAADRAADRAAGNRVRDPTVVGRSLHHRKCQLPCLGKLPQRSAERKMFVTTRE